MAGYFLRMRLILLFSALLLITVIAGAQEKSSHRKIACKTPANADICYWAHGRLSFYNGTPSIRLWKIGTRRMLGIYSGPNSEKIDALDNEHPELPDNLRERFKPSENRIFADFEVCPLEPEKDNGMQAACIESAKKVTVEP